MKQLRFSSFRQRLNAAFLAVSLVPVLLCSALLLQIFRLRMTADQQQNAEQQLDGACHALFSMQEGLQEAAITLGGSETVARCRAVGRTARAYTARSMTRRRMCAGLRASSFTTRRGRSCMRRRR